MECLHLFKAAKLGSLKMHVQVGKNIIFQNKTFLVMFYRQNKTFQGLDFVPSRENHILFSPDSFAKFSFYDKIQNTAESNCYAN